MAERNPERALHYSEGKPDLSQIPPEWMFAMASVLDYGAKKYDRDNWRKGTNWSEMTASALRHLMHLIRGERFDRESGLHHAAQLMVNGGFLLTWDLYDRGTNNFYQYPDKDAVIMIDPETKEPQLVLPSPYWWRKQSEPVEPARIWLPKWKREGQDPC
jgi:hypothetical protein